MLYMTIHEEGQSLVELESRVAAFRLKAVQKLLYHTCWLEGTSMRSTEES